MSGILEIPAVRRQVFPVPVEFYHQAGALGMLGEDVELLEGVIVKQMAKSPLHTLLVALLEALLRRCLPPGTTLRKEEPLAPCRFGARAGSRGRHGPPRDFTDAHPATARMVAEVALATEERDRRKAAIYARARVAECWLVEPDQRRLTVFRRPQEGAYAEAREHAPEETAASEVIPGFQVSLAGLLKP